jgi:hypothetical protein
MVNYFASYVNAPMLRLSAFSDVAARIRNETPQHEIGSDVEQRVRLSSIDPNQITHRWPSVARWRAF